MVVSGLDEHESGGAGQAEKDLGMRAVLTFPDGIRRELGDHLDAVAGDIP
jgi:hypothetical protein